MTCRIVDALMFVGQSRFGGGEDLETVLARTEPNHDTAICVSAMPADRDLQRANRNLIAAAHDRPDIVPLVRVDPHASDAVDMAVELVHLGGRGLFLHPWEDTYRVTDETVVGPVMRCAADLDVPVVVEAGFPWVSESLQVGQLARRHPAVSIVASRGNQMNMSGLGTEAAGRALADNPNLHYLTASVYRQDWLDALIMRGDWDRLLYASLAPTFDARLEWLRVERSAATPAQLERIAGGNADQLFRIPSTAVHPDNGTP